MRKNAVIIKSSPHGLILVLDPDLPFEELNRAVADKFASAAGFFRNANVAVTFRGRVLSGEQERMLIDTIAENSRLRILCVVDERREVDEYFRDAVIRSLDRPAGSEGQFYRGTLRSGQVLETDTSVVVIGDVNPGAQVVSRGNIVVLGCCMGTIYAGAGGDSSCFAAALTMKPMQIRIADKMARSAIVKRTDTGDYPIDPKIAYLRDGHIQIRALSSSALGEYLG